MSAGDGKAVVVKVKLWNVRASKTKALELLMRNQLLMDPNPEPVALGPVFIWPPGTHIDVHDETLGLAGQSK